MNKLTRAKAKQSLFEKQNHPNQENSEILTKEQVLFKDGETNDKTVDEESKIVPIRREEQLTDEESTTTEPKITKKSKNNEQNYESLAKIKCYLYELEEMELIASINTYRCKRPAYALKTILIKARSGNYGDPFRYFRQELLRTVSQMCNYTRRSEKFVRDARIMYQYVLKRPLLNDLFEGNPTKERIREIISKVKIMSHNAKEEFIKLAIDAHCEKDSYEIDFKKLAPNIIRKLYLYSQCTATKEENTIHHQISFENSDDSFNSDIN